MSAKEEPKTRKGTVPVKFMPERDRWMLTVRDRGKKKRTFHKTEEAALRAWRSHCRHLARFGSESRVFTSEEVQEYLEAKRLAPDADLREVARFYAAHRPTNAEAMTVSDAVDLFLQAKRGRKNLSDRHLDTMKGHLARFAVTFGEVDVKEVTGNHVSDWLDGLGKSLEPRGVWNYYGSLCNLFNWLARKEFIVDAPTSGVAESDLPIIPKKPKGILTVNQSAAMMDWIDWNRPGFAAGHALQLFAGIRRAEVERMNWSSIDLDARTITLLGWSEDGERLVKTGDDWMLHDLPVNLWSWLEKHRG